MGGGEILASGDDEKGRREERDSPFFKKRFHYCIGKVSVVSFNVCTLPALD